MPSPTVFIVDDDESVLDSLRALLQSEGLPTECFSSAECFLSHVDASRPGCIVLDLNMPSVTGTELLRRLREQNCARPAVIITGYAEIETVVRTMKLGVSEFLMKPCLPSKLIEAVKTALAHDSAERKEHQERRRCVQRIEALSKDERRVLDGIVQGLSNRELADALDVSLRTVQLRRAALFARLEVKSVVELMAFLRKAEGR